MKIRDLLLEPGTDTLSIGRCAFVIFFLVATFVYFTGNGISPEAVALLGLLLGYNAVKKLPSVNGAHSAILNLATERGLIKPLKARKTRKKPKKEINYEARD